jgi:hypothetical protein
MLAPDGVVEVRVSDGTKEEDQEEEEEEKDVYECFSWKTSRKEHMSLNNMSRVY